MPTEVPNLKCPHCNGDLSTIEFRKFGDGKTWLIGCPHCFKVIGANYEVNPQS